MWSSSPSPPLNRTGWGPRKDSTEFRPQTPRGAVGDPRTDMFTTPHAGLPDPCLPPPVLGQGGPARAQGVLRPQCYVQLAGRLLLWSRTAKL